MRRKIGIVILLGVLMMGLFGCAKKYKVDYNGHKAAFPGAKDSYRAGEKVRLVYDIIATDTDYSFHVEGAEYRIDYSDGEGYVVTFTMPNHDVSVQVESRNSMVWEP